MKKYLFKLSLFISILIVCLLVVCYGMYQWMLTNPNQYTLFSHEINVRQSVERLKKKTSPSIIIIGGSGCGSGFISPLLSSYYKMPVINTGTHAGLGLRLQVLLIKPYVKQGDIVLVIPEYSQFSDTFYGPETTWRIMTATMQEEMDSISIKQYLYLSKYFFTAFKEAWKAYNAPSPKSDDSNGRHSPYSSHSLNEYGDVTFYEYRLHKDIPMLKERAKGMAHKKSINRETLSLLTDFREYCQCQSAMFLLFPPTYREEAFEMEKDYIQRIENVLYKENIPYVVEPKRYEFPDSLFYDSNYHLTYEGCFVRTKMIIEDMDYALRH